MTYGLPPMLMVGLITALVTTALTAGLVALTALAWRRRYWSWWGRIHYTLVTAAAAAILWSQAYLNMIGFHY